MSELSFETNLVDLHQEKIIPTKITINNGRIISREEISKQPNGFILPGFIDSHVHIESSMMVPSEFARMAMVHGTIGAIADPHEIANVLGNEGIQFMLGNASQSPFYFSFGAPSCVPATTFETSGAVITASEIEELLKSGNAKFLSEVMNFPGVLNDFPDVIEKINIAKKYNKRIDGHAPGLRGSQLKKYIGSGISTDHECFSLVEALEKIQLGMKIQIREGSAAKNFEELCSLIETHTYMCMFASDDKHPDDLLKSHINELVRRSIEKKYDLFNVLRVACLNPAEHYGLESGQLRVGDSADFIIIDDLKEFKVKQTFIKGQLVAENGESKISKLDVKPINVFNAQKKEIQDFAIKGNCKKIRVIEVFDKQIITEEAIVTPKIEDESIVPDIENDILKIAVVNRYQDSKPAIGFIKNFGLKKGAIGSSVAHDSHNIIAVAADDKSLTDVVNALIESKGGIAATDGLEMKILPMPVAGLMSDKEGTEIAKKYSELDSFAKELGTKLTSPFMSLSFMALLVIPELKLSDKGLFDAVNFKFVGIDL